MNRNEIIEKGKYYKKISVEKYQSEQFERKINLSKNDLDMVRSSFWLANENAETITKNYSKEY